MRKLGWQILLPIIVLIICIMTSIGFVSKTEPMNIAVRYFLILAIIIGWNFIDIFYSRIFDKSGIARKESAASFLHDLFDVSVYDTSLNKRCVSYFITAIANSLIFVIIDLAFAINYQPITLIGDIILSVSVFYIVEYFKGEY